jgi:hypothetical protein
MMPVPATRSTIRSTRKAAVCAHCEQCLNPDRTPADHLLTFPQPPTPLRLKSVPSVPPNCQSVSNCLALFITHVTTSTLKMEARHVPPKRRFIINPHSATSQKTAFFNCHSVHKSLQVVSNLYFADA